MKIRWEEDSSIYGLDLVGFGLIGSPLIYLTTGAGSFWNLGGGTGLIVPQIDCGGGMGTAEKKI